MTIFSKRNYSLMLAFLLAFSFCAQAQETAPKPGTSAKTDETAIYLDAPAQGAQTGSVKSSSPSSLWILVRIVVVLALVCAGIYGVVYLLKKSTKVDVGNDPFLKSVATLSVGPNRSIQVVTLGERAYMVGVTEHAVNLLAEVTDKEVIDAMNLEVGKKIPVPGGNFAALMSRLLAKKNTASGSGVAPASTGSEDGGSAFATTDFLRKQRERLNGSSDNSGNTRPDGSRPSDRGAAE
jgi:flagellar protein FliO/FliZ